MRTTCLAAAIALAATTASATTLASSPLYGGTSQHYAVCYLFNASKGLVTVTSSSIVIESNGNDTLNSDSCTGNTLRPHHSCAFGATFSDPVDQIATHVCQVTLTGLSGALKGMRGTIDLRDTSAKILSSAPMN